MTEINGLCERMLARGVGAEIVGRVRRLNASYRRGEKIRGIHRKANPRWLFGWVSKGELIRRHGRSAWESVPEECRRKDGRREYITNEAYLDNVWLEGAPKGKELD